MFVHMYVDEFAGKKSKKEPKPYHSNFGENITYKITFLKRSKI